MFICALFSIQHISDIIWYLSFWVTSRSVIIYRPIHVAAGGIISFFLACTFKEGDSGSSLHLSNYNQPSVSTSFASMGSVGWISRSRPCGCRGPVIFLLHVWSVMSDSLQPHGLEPPGSSVHGTSQARILEWAVTPFSRESSPARGRTLLHICSVGRQILCGWATWEVFMVLQHFIQGTWIPMDFVIFRGFWNQPPMDT